MVELSLFPFTPVGISDEVSCARSCATRKSHARRSLSFF